MACRIFKSKENEKELLKQLKSDYEALEIKPSSDLWDRIEQEARKVLLYAWKTFSVVEVCCGADLAFFGKYAALFQ
ncbi:hypothetical protein EJ377_20440 [Chryseobacterium arthrosphaerae]|uniref:Uncharacterized protein n=1 Tax=Chryseobacterium arthrosphaerae TaxID=651561 RepID=A0A3S0NLG4_9FLAO|nr:hypothetical protein EJ377_20440 [Chryseobacterium arthrosphaerae]